MMKKKVMPLSCLMAAAMLAGCGTAAPAVSEKTTAPASETAEAAQETADIAGPPRDARHAGVQTRAELLAHRGKGGFHVARPEQRAVFL